MDSKTKRVVKIYGGESYLPQKGALITMQCVDCPHIKSIENSEGEIVYLCVCVSSGAYLEETGILGNCGWNGYDDCGVFYHVTALANVPSIRRNGLQPKIGKRSSDCQEKVEAIFLFPDQESMEDALSNWLGEELGDEELAILEIRLPESYASDLDSDSKIDYEVRCKREIPSDYIRFLHEDMSEIVED